MLNYWLFIQSEDKDNVAEFTVQHYTGQEHLDLGDVDCGMVVVADHHACMSLHRIIWSFQCDTVLQVKTACWWKKVKKTASGFSVQISVCQSLLVLYM